jgi:hypothetical protein
VSGHPLVLALLLTDALGAALLAGAGWGAVRVAAHWSPGSPTRAQLALERSAESSALAGRWALHLLTLSTLMLIAALSGELPRMVPGAMCGTGVVQASGGRLTQALALRALGLLLLHLWHGLQRLDEQQPDRPLTVAAARLLLAALPVSLVAVSQSLQALIGLDLQSPVSCCAALYESVRAAPAAAGLSEQSPPWRLWLFMASSALLMVIALAVQGTGAPRRLPVVLLVLTALWALAAHGAVTRHLGAAIYGVRYHPCPWCLFLPEHRCIGVLMLSASAVVLGEVPIVWLSAWVGRSYPELTEAAGRRLRNACRHTLMGCGGLLAAACLPALIWRLRFGVWLLG